MKAVTKRTVWENFSKYIRLKECMETTGSFEFGRCCTCGRIKPFKELDSGHFISGRSNSILFHESGVHIQCQRCNRFSEGNKSAYYKYMLEKYGQEEIDKLEALKRMKKKLSAFELMAINKYYKDKTKELLQGEKLKKCIGGEK